jgi:hypothetical protein
MSRKPVLAWALCGGCPFEAAYEGKTNQAALRFVDQAMSKHEKKEHRAKELVPR